MDHLSNAKAAFSINSCSADIQDKLKALTKEKCEIVLSRYNEDVSWSDDFKHLRTVYNKGSAVDYDAISLPNVGRESHTFLHHIITNYDKLADTTVFFQAMINDRHEQRILPFHMYLLNTSKGIVGNAAARADNYDWKYSSKYTIDHSGRSKYKFGEFIERVLKRKFKFPQHVILGAYMSVGRDVILRNPKSYYQNILEKTKLATEIDPEEGHFMERSWIHMFID